jgi:phosphatidate cytidylyltransferase
MSEAVVKKSDLGVRAASAVVMIAVAGTSIWLGGWVFAAFVVAVALGVLWEWRGLVNGFSLTASRKALWMVSGVIYVALGSSILWLLRSGSIGTGILLVIVGAVISTDVGAYLVGRTVGGPKIAPAISPSKTWAGLFGGILGASLAIVLILTAWNAGLCGALYPRTNEFMLDGPCSQTTGVMNVTFYVLQWAMISGPVIAVVAQAGDFFQSWMKRRAGVKDSGNLLPGHGGLFDRIDGLLAVLFVAGVIAIGFLGSGGQL